MKMKCLGKREIFGEVKKEWMESVKEWKPVEKKEVLVVKREDNIRENEIHMSKRSSFTMNGRMIRCSEKFQSWIIDRELKSTSPSVYNNILYIYYL